MIKIVTEPSRLVDIIRKSLMNGELDVAVASFSPEGLVISDISKRTMGSYCTFSRGFFKQYHVDETQDVIINKAFLDNLTMAMFGREEEVSLEVDLENKKFIIDSKKHHWEPTLSEETGEKITWETLKEMPEVGFVIQAEDRPILNQFSLPVDELNTPKVEKLTFKVLNKQLTIELELDGPWKKTPTLMKTKKLDVDGVSTVYIKFLTAITASFKGEVWITVYERGIFITQITTDFSLMYSLAST